jgi:hypothetical protein
MRYSDEELDVPCITSTGISDQDKMAEDAETALKWTKQFIESNKMKIEAKIRRNNHDFGEYLSIGLWFSHERCELFDSFEGCNGCEMCDSADKAWSDVNVLTEAYSEHFKQWL